jgi:beta-aspartyl-peptidase (threonine type)
MRLVNCISVVMPTCANLKLSAKGIRVSLLNLAILSTLVSQAQNTNKHWVIEVHGGAGDIMRATTDPGLDTAYRQKLTEAINAAGRVLEKGGSSVDAVETAIRILENATLFDAGKGAYFDADGKIELDAAIMDGSTLNAGSVAAVMHAKHPISLARAVMERTPYVMLAGSGADEFLHSTHGEEVDPLYFYSESKWQALINQLKREGKPIPPRPAGAPAAPGTGVGQLNTPQQGQHYGTVGVVAMDLKGNLAAGTSTGGSQGKLRGRVGDSPIVGAGTYASNESCAVSTTGVGEFFIRLTIARDVCALMQYEGMPLQRAADEVIHLRLAKMHSEGGLIAISPDGQAVWSFNTPGMFRARLRQGSTVEVSIYRDEP